MNYGALVEMVGLGDEYDFTYNNDDYWISCNQNGHHLTRVRDSHTQSFKTTDELFADGRIEGKTIADIWDDISDQF